jgi:hypothetical protein
VFSVFIFPPLNWEDYSITYNGAKLLYDGYKPYTDFGITTGIGNFILPYFSFLIFGPSYNSLYILQACEHIFLLFISFKIFELNGLSKKKLELIFGIFTLIFTFSVINKVKISFYNSEFLLYQLTSMYFLLLTYKSATVNKYLYTSIATFFSFMCFQVKQDFGGMFLIISFLVIFINFFKEFNWKIPLIYFVTFVTLSIVFLIIINPNDFLYWFNYGQSYQPKRNILAKIWSSLNESKEVNILLLLCSLLSILYIFKGRNNKNIHSDSSNSIILVIGMGLENIVTLSSSNFPYLMYATPFLYINIIEILIDNRKKIFSFVIVVYVVFFYMFTSFSKDIKSIFWFYEPNEIVNTIKIIRGKEVKRETGPSVFKYYGISENYIANKKDFNYCLKILDSIYNINKKPLVIANFTDLPIEGVVPYSRIKGLPLWPDNDVLLLEREQKMYLNLLRHKKFDIIFNLKINFSGYNFINNAFENEAKSNYFEVYLFDLVKYYPGKRSISILIKK